MFNYTYNNPYYQTMQRPQTMEQQYTQYVPQTQQPMSQSYRQPMGMQFKYIDSLDAAKVIDLPLDGSPIFLIVTDGSAIATKQLQQDGTSKTLVYKLDNEEKLETTTEYVTLEQLENALESKNNNGDIKDIKEEIKSIKRQIRDINEDLKENKKKE